MNWTYSSFALLLVLQAAVPSPLPDFYRNVDRLTWIVDDVDATVRGWKKLGFENIREPGEIELAVTFRGKKETVKCRAASGWLGDLAVDWYQLRGGNNAFSEFKARHGAGVFSIVHRIPDRRALDAELQRMRQLGVSVLQTVDPGTSAGPTTYTYLDTETGGKYVLGLVLSSAPLTAPPAAAKPCGPVVQYAFTVRRLDPVFEYWKRLGFTQTSVTHPTLWDLRYHDRPGNFDAELGWQRHGKVVYEWILPLKGPTVYQDQLDRHGEGVHHIAFEVPDLDKEVARWNSLGFPFVQGGAWGEKGKPGYGRFAYQSTQTLGGTDVELLWNFR